MHYTSMLLVWLLASTALAQSDADLDIVIRGGSRDFKVALQRFSHDPQSREFVEPFYAGVIEALKFSGGFSMVPEEAFLEPLQTRDFSQPSITCDNWRGIGTDILVEGRIEVRGARERVRYRLWDVGRCQVQGKPGYLDARPEDLWLVARQLADEIIYRFTGRRGVAATQVAFVSDRTGNKEVYVMEADGSRRKRVTANGNINLFPAWSPDGNTLLYTSYRAGAADLWLLARGQPGRRLLRVPDEKYRGVFGPRDGQVTFVMNQKGNTDLFLTASRGGGVERLTTSRAIEVSPSWSPSGDKLAFASDRSGTQQLYLKDLASGQIRRLTFKGDYNASPAWSPTGEWIAYAARTGNSFDLYLIDPESGYTTQLTNHPRTEENPAWSPDGRKVAFVSNRFGRKEIFSVDVDGRNLRRLTEGFGNSSNPAWSSWLP